LTGEKLTIILALKNPIIKIQQHMTETPGRPVRARPASGHPKGIVMTATVKQIHEEIVKIAGSEGGRAAQDLVNTVSTGSNVESHIVQRALRSMLEKGIVRVGPNMNLIVDAPPAAGRDG
jgi:hypothetical protein